VIALFNHFEIEMTKADAHSMSHSSVGADVRALLPKFRKQLNKISDADLSSELAEYGAWDETERADREMNEVRILWIAAGDILANGYEFTEDGEIA